MSNSQGKQNRPSGMFTKESVDEYRRRTTRFDLGDIKFRRIYPFWGAFMLMLVVVIAVSSLRTSVEHETTIIASGSMCRSLLTNGRLGSSQRIHVALIRRDDGRAVTLVGGTRFRGGFGSRFLGVGRVNLCRQQWARPILSANFADPRPRYPDRQSLFWLSRKSLAYPNCRRASTQHTRVTP